VDDEGFNLSVMNGMLKKIGILNSDRALDGGEAVRNV